MTDYSGLTVLITGAAGGIGNAAATAFHKAGANLILSDIQTKGLLQGNHILPLECDVTDKASVENMVTKGAAHFGRIDVAINNAGISGKHNKFINIEDAEWHRIIAVNLTGTYYALKAELNVMIKQNGGRIINVASLAGVVGSPNLAAYSASKHGVVGLTKSLVHEVGRYNITLNALCPGYIETPMIQSITEEKDESILESSMNPMRRFGTTEEITNALLWMASPKNSFMNGQTIVLDGGISAI